MLPYKRGILSAMGPGKVDPLAIPEGIAGWMEWRGNTGAQNGPEKLTRCIHGEGFL